MTTPTNWPNPERPGVPMFPERDGWHWLSNSPGEAPFPAEWRHEDYCGAETEWFWDMGEEREDAYEMRGLYYRGLCPLPGMANETACIALNNIATLAERARKNIATAAGARKMAKALAPILADIDNQVNDIRNIYVIITPTQISEMLAGERERAAKKAQEISDKYYDEREKASRRDDRDYADERMCAASECAEAIRNLGAAS